MPRSMVVRPAGGAAVGVPADVMVDTDDYNPRPTDTRYVWAMLIDADRLPVALAGVSVTFELYKNGSTIGAGSYADGAVLSDTTVLTNALGVSAIGITYNSNAGADDIFQVYAYL